MLSSSMLLGLTGQIGAGKSTASRILREFGAYIIDADLIGKDVVENSPTLLRKLTRQFGKDILTSSSKLNRKALASRAFASDETKAALDTLVHPYLLKELRLQVKALQKNYSVVVIDAALLLDWELDKEVDYVLVITASQTNRVARMHRRGFSTEEVLARQSTQPSLIEYRTRADYVIPNNGTEEMLRRRLFHLWGRLNAKTN
jgi:dephospho-CoA kinase